eukprot:248748_1
MQNVHEFLSKCTNPKIAQFAKRFKANNDMKALSSSLQNLLHEDYEDISEFGPEGAMSHYFSGLADHYTHNGVQDIIKKIEKDELALMDDKVKEYTENYPFINQLQAHDDENRNVKIKPRSQWMHRMLLDNGADVNFPCLNSSNPNHMIVSPLGICLTRFFDSLNDLGIIQDLLNRQARLGHAEIPILSQLFVKVASKKEDEMDIYFGILEKIAKNSGVLLQNVTDLDDNNPIHTAIIHHHAFNQNEGTRNTTETTRQARCISVLCRRYPFWIKQRNIAGDYPLLLSVKYRDVASIFALMSFLSAHDYDAMNHMLQQRIFAESMIKWAVELLPKSNDDPCCDIQIIKIFLELYGYEAIFCWPNPLSNTPSPSPQAAITLMDLIQTKEETQRNTFLDILIKKCNVIKYAKDKNLIEIKTAPPTVEDNEVDYEFQASKKQQQTEEPVANDAIINSNEIQKKIGAFGFDINLLPDEEDQNEYEETDEKEDAEQEVGDEEDAEKALEDEEDIEPLPKETEAVNWIELFYSMLVESFSTADLYTDIVIMIGLFQARQQWWVTFMIAFLTAPYLVSY